jgi:hypothetical protein
MYRYKHVRMLTHQRRLVHEDAVLVVASGKEGRQGGIVRPRETARGQGRHEFRQCLVGACRQDWWWRVGWMAARWAVGKSDDNFPGQSGTLWRNWDCLGKACGTEFFITLFVWRLAKLSGILFDSLSLDTHRTILRCPRGLSCGDSGFRGWLVAAVISAARTWDGSGLYRSCEIEV